MQALQYLWLFALLQAVAVWASVTVIVTPPADVQPNTSIAIQGQSNDPHTPEAVNGVFIQSTTNPAISTSYALPQVIVVGPAPIPLGSFLIGTQFDGQSAVNVFLTFQGRPLEAPTRVTLQNPLSPAQLPKLAIVGECSKSDGVHFKACDVVHFVMQPSYNDYSEVQFTNIELSAVVVKNQQDMQILYTAPAFVFAQEPPVTQPLYDWIISPCFARAGDIRVILNYNAVMSGRDYRMSSYVDIRIWGSNCTPCTPDSELSSSNASGCPPTVSFKHSSSEPLSSSAGESLSSSECEPCQPRDRKVLPKLVVGKRQSHYKPLDFVSLNVEIPRIANSTGYTHFTLAAESTIQGRLVITRFYKLPDTFPGTCIAHIYDWQIPLAWRNAGFTKITLTYVAKQLNGAACPEIIHSSVHIRIGSCGEESSSSNSCSNGKLTSSSASSSCDEEKPICKPKTEEEADSFGDDDDDKSWNLENMCETQSRIEGNECEEQQFLDELIEEKTVEKQQCVRPLMEEKIVELKPCVEQLNQENCDEESVSSCDSKPWLEENNCGLNSWSEENSCELPQIWCKPCSEKNICEYQRCAKPIITQESECGYEQLKPRVCRQQKDCEYTPWIEEVEDADECEQYVCENNDDGEEWTEKNYCEPKSWHRPCPRPCSYNDAYECREWSRPCDYESSSVEHRPCNLKPHGNYRPCSRPCPKNQAKECFPRPRTSSSGSSSSCSYSKPCRQWVPECNYRPSCNNNNNNEHHGRVKCREYRNKGQSCHQKKHKKRHDDYSEESGSGEEQECHVPRRSSHHKADSRKKHSEDKKEYHCEKPKCDATKPRCNYEKNQCKDTPKQECIDQDEKEEECDIDEEKENDCDIEEECDIQEEKEDECDVDDDDEKKEDFEDELDAIIVNGIFEFRTASIGVAVGGVAYALMMLVL